MTSPIVTIAGAKGGVGKTTTSINLASAIAGPDRTVAVVEMDLAMANFVDFLSIPSGAADPTLHDVLAGDAEPFDAVYPFGDHVAAVPSGTTLDGYARAEMDDFPRVLKRYAMEFDVVVVDTGAGLSRLVVDPIGIADGAVVVSTPRVAAVRDADKTVKLCERVGTPVLGLVLTQSGTGESPGPERISDFLGVDLLGHVPDDKAVPSSQDQGVPVVTRAPESPAGSTYHDIAEDLLFTLSTHADTPSTESGDAGTTASTADTEAAEPAVDGGSATKLANEERTPEDDSGDQSGTGDPTADAGERAEQDADDTDDPPGQTTDPVDAGNTDARATARETTGRDGSVEPAADEAGESDDAGRDSEPADSADRTPAGDDDADTEDASGESDDREPAETDRAVHAGAEETDEAEDTDHDVSATEEDDERPEAKSSSSRPETVETAQSTDREETEETTDDERTESDPDSSESGFVGRLRAFLS